MTQTRTKNPKKNTCNRKSERKLTNTRKKFHMTILMNPVIATSLIEQKRIVDVRLLVSKLVSLGNKKGRPKTDDLEEQDHAA